MGHYQRRARLRPTTICFTLALLIGAIAVNALWLWIVLAIWLLASLYAIYAVLTGRV